MEFVNTSKEVRDEVTEKSIATLQKDYVIEVRNLPRGNDDYSKYRSITRNLNLI